MNKRANIYLNIYGFLTFLLSISSIGLSLTLSYLPFEIPSILKTVTFTLGLLFGIIFTGIELFLFILFKGSYKVIYLLSIILDILIAIEINKRIPFMALGVFLVLYPIKDILRVIFVEKIFLPNEFNRYCKMFHIKVKDFTKKKTPSKKEKWTSEKDSLIISTKEVKRKTITQTKKQSVA